MSAVERTVRILEVLSRAGAINLENLSRETDLPKATLLRFLGTLSALGYVCRDDADRYSLTLKLFSISSRALQHSDLIAKARPFAQQLCQSLGETVHMGILEGDRAVYVLKEESSYTLRIDDQEHEDSVMCLASPIRDYTGQVVAAMSVSWPIFRFNQADFEKIVCEITSATDQLSAIMGWERS